MLTSVDEQVSIIDSCCYYQKSLCRVGTVLLELNQQLKLWLKQIKSL